MMRCLPVRLKHLFIQLLISKYKVRHLSTVHSMCRKDWREVSEHVMLYLHGRTATCICSLTFNDVHIKIFHIQSLALLFGKS